MKVRDVMTATAATVPESATLRDVVDAMLLHDVSGLPVTGAGGQVVGVVSEADLLGKEAISGRRPPRLLGFVSSAASRRRRFAVKAQGMTARDVMSSPAVVAAADEDLRDAARRMIERGLKRLPVVRDGAAVGVLSRHDVLRVFTRSDEELHAAVGESLSPFAGWMADFDVQVSVSSGVVTLDGTVTYTSDARLIGEAVRGVEGVLGVVNNVVSRWDKAQTE